MRALRAAAFERTPVRYFVHLISHGLPIASSRLSENERVVLNAPKERYIVNQASFSALEQLR